MKYMLLIVDTFSRYLWSFPLKGKSAREVQDAFESIKSRHPMAIMADEGTEFMGTFLKYCTQKGIRIYHIYGDHKAAIAERAIRTIQTLLWRLMTARDTRKWVDLLPLAVEFYNTSKHRALDGLTPTQASDPANQRRLWLHQYGTIQPNTPDKPKFNIGDAVRVSVYHGAFDKGYHGNWSLDAYVVAAISLGRPVMYSINNLDGTPVQGRFYEEQLLRTQFPRLEIKHEAVYKAKPKNYTIIERVQDVVDQRDSKPWLFEGKPMIWLKIKWEGTTEAENEALPLAKLWIPYIDLAFDREGLPNPAIEALLRKRRLWTKAQEYKLQYFAKARKPLKAQPPKPLAVLPKPAPSPRRSRRGGIIWLPTSLHYSR